MKKNWYRALAILAAAGGMLGWVFTPGRSYVEQSDSAIRGTEQTEITTQGSGVTFPYTLTGSGLVVEGMIQYSGAYMEDGSGDLVEDVTGLMVYNPSERMVRFGAIAVEQGGKQLYFFVYCLPPDSRCLILEKNRHPYNQQAVMQCRDLSVRWEYQDLHAEQVHYMGFGECLTVVNHSAKQQRHISLWYKQYHREGGYYLGGVAYSAHVFRLNSQEQRILKPEHYHAGSAKVVAIELEGA